MAPRPQFLLAQVSDLHIRADGRLSYGVVDTVAMFRSCVARILKLEPRPDAVALTGDLTDGGAPEEYELLRELIAPLPMPVYVIPGNHDSREALRTAFRDAAWVASMDPPTGFFQYTVDAHPLRIVALDTTIPGASGGELGEARLEWLDRTLAAAPTKATVVLMHHPPFTTFIGHMDAFGLRDPERLAGVLARHHQVEAILCGHVHRPVVTRFAGTVAAIAPSCAHQIALDLDPAMRGRFVMEPPAFMLHAYSRDAGLISHIAYIGEFAGPHFFRGA